MRSEFGLIEKLKSLVPKTLQGKPGIGDDAAVIEGPGGDKWLLTTDAIGEGFDFVWGKASPEKVGRKALAINLSDIAAMGGVPVAFVATLGIPRKVKGAWVEKFYRGMIRLAKRYKTLCVGGDLTASREFFASVALLGRVSSEEIIFRRGAKQGDWIGVTGRLGGSILGHHLDFEPRIFEARFLAQKFHPTAMMDISDGLWQDLEHLLGASRVGARLDLEHIPVSRDALNLAQGNSAKALVHALTDGEDFELLFTVPSARRHSLELAWRKKFPTVSLSWIGIIQEGRGIEWTRGDKPTTPPLASKKGFAHF